MINARSMSVLLLVIVLTAACGRPEPVPESAPAPTLAGSWRAVLTSPGGELPFRLEITEEDGKLAATALTGPEEIPFSTVEQNGSEVILHFTWYDSEITARLDESGTLTGTWRRTSPGGTDSTLPFAARRGAATRFLPLAEAGLATSETSLASVAGHWSVEFTDEDGSEPARGEFEQDGARVTGTFLTPVGDYRYLEGSYEGGVLRLSTFDGAHAFLFTARTQDDGTLAGDFWSRDSYHATWTASPITAGEAVLPDGWTQVGLTNDDGRFSFEFPDLEGNVVSLADDRFAGKVVLVNIFGSWCPNCNDEAPLLARWHQTYRDRGLEIVGLAYEFTGEAERDRRQVQRFAERYGISYPLLLAGTSDKQAAGETLPDLTAVKSYPTTVFISRDGKVRKIYSGFSGPGTGSHYEKLVTEVEELIEELVAES